MHGRGKKHEKGQSLVEFALSLPILILILSGLIDIGRVYFAYIFLEEAAAEAALYMSLHPDCVNATSLPTGCEDPNNALWRAQYSGSTQGILGPVSITTPLIGSVALSQTVEVTATAPFYFITPGMSALMKSINGNGSDVLNLKIIATRTVIAD